MRLLIGVLLLRFRIRMSQDPRSLVTIPSGPIRRVGARIARVLGFEPRGDRAALARAEFTARQAQSRLREAIDVLPEGIVFLDPQGRYILWNKRYAEIYHRSADLFAEGRRLEDTLRIGVERGDYPEAVGREEAWLAERIALMDNPGQRHQQRLADGRWVMIEERRTEDGGIIGLRIDITDLKRQADELEGALERAETANRAKSRFLANLSHEIRTPLNGVLGMADVLARSPLDPSQREVLANITASASRLNAVLGDLLDLSRLEAGQIEIRSAPFELAELLDEVVAGRQPAAREKGLALEVRARLASGARVMGDAVRLKQVLDHLLDNAIKFTRHGFVELSVTPGSGAHDYRFEVRDSGVGFAPEDAERLFTGFEQADGSFTRAHGGAGLGLAICRQLAGLMGGRIAADGYPGRGAVFTLDVPLKPVGALGSPRMDRATVGGAPRVLAADDNAVNRKLVELILGTIGAEVVSVENGLEALQALEQQNFDLVLMDLQMPVMDGLTAIRRIRAWEAAANRPRMPIVVLSANVMPEHRQASAAAGADDHIAKPVTVEQLASAVLGAVRAESSDAASVA
jgi:signal transduction histidine kinase/ActR/RegA family two-component response regulator